jgi:hypothetical protein
MEPGNKKSAFKLRSGNKPSIAKLAGLKDLFGKLQDIGQKAKDFKEKRQSESRINIKQDMEDKIARTRRGESKFQEKTRMRKEFNKFKRRNKMIDKDKDGMSDLIQAPPKPPKGKETVSTKSKTKTKQKSKGYYYTFSGKKGDKFKYRSGPDGGNYLEGYEFQRPGSDVWETSKTEAGKKAIHNLFISDYKGKNLDMTPITKRKYKKKK